MEEIGVERIIFIAKIVGTPATACTSKITGTTNIRLRSNNT